MSTGSPATLLLKAAPRPEQIADRLAGGPWPGLELALMPGDVADDAALERAIAAVRDGLAGTGMVVTAEAPVAWPSGAFVRVDRLDEEAAAGIRRSAAFAAGIGSPVLTIHLFAPQSPDEFRRGDPLDEDETQRFMEHFARECAAAGVTPLIENVPPILRMRTGGVFLSPVGGHWRDLLAWRARVPELGFTIDTSHAALFRSFAGAYPGLFGLRSDEELELERYVEELGPAAEVAHVSDAEGVLGEGLNVGAGELDLDPVVRRLGELVPFIVAEVNEPDHERSPNMKAGLRDLERALELPAERWTQPPRRLLDDDFDWHAVIGLRDPLPAVLELEELVRGASVLITGGAGSIGRRLATLLSAFRPGLVTLLDQHEASLAADRRARGPAAAASVEHALCDLRDRTRLQAEVDRARPDVVFHLAAYKHVDWAERYPDEFVATNLEGSWNVLRAVGAAGAHTVVVASTDKAALAANLYGRTKRLMEQLTNLEAERSGGARAAVRLVNVLGTTGSASDLFLRQARGGVPLTVTDTGMIRYWITGGHAAALLAHGALLARDGHRLVTAAEPVELTVGDIAERIWRHAGCDGEPDIALLGIRPGETMREVLIGPGETLGDETFQGSAPIAGGAGTLEAAEVLDRLEHAASPAERRATWLDLLRRPGLFAAPA
jgi:nucleoside-diphosphate-sugar epimerase/sugar phosphate isomerase/epimerase